MKRRVYGAVVGAVFAACCGAPVSAADIAHGKQLFAACAACHSDRPDAIGPSLHGVIGRKAGTVAGFRYSPAMKRAGFVWDEAALRAYLTDPQAKVKGNRMPFSGFSNPNDVNDVVAYVATLK